MTHDPRAAIFGVPQTAVGVYARAIGLAGLIAVVADERELSVG